MRSTSETPSAVQAALVFRGLLQSRGAHAIHVSPENYRRLREWGAEIDRELALLVADGPPRWPMPAYDIKIIVDRSLDDATVLAEERDGSVRRLPWNMAERRSTIQAGAGGGGMNR